MTDAPQGSDEWREARLGCVTGSRVDQAIARNKAGTAWLKGRGDYMADVIAERLSGVPNRSYTSGAMRWGNEQEPEARAAYEFRSGHEVELSEFVPHPRIAFAGASPDGLIGDIGLVEIKCPDTPTHIETLESGKVPDEYMPQIMWQMACTGRAWCDYASFDPRLPPWASLFILRVHRDEARIAEMETMVSDFLDEVARKVAFLRKQYEPPIARIMSAG